ncbi:MAG: T9SS type A sorting domain-containing protein [Gelidibacter sp.]
MKTKLVLCIFLIKTIMGFSQWNQIGNIIVGDSPLDEFGLSVDINSEGTIVAIGSYATTPGSSEDTQGLVRVFENISGVWTQIGADIYGEHDDDFSIFPSLNSEGNILAIGAYGNDYNGVFAGYVRVFENIAGVWTQIGSDINGENPGDFAGHSVSLNANGNIVAIGSPGNFDNGTIPGHVSVFENIGGVWTQIGSNINGESSGDRAGQSISLNSNGDIVAIGSPLNDDNGNDSGHVRVFQNIAGVWTQIGSNINGGVEGDWTGFSVSLNSNGNILAIGSPNVDDTVSVYEYIAGIWTQIGSFDNVENWGTGRSVSLNANGDILAIGSPYNYRTGQTYAGHVKVYKKIAGVWTQVNADIFMQNSFNLFGWSVSLNSDGDTLAVGAPYYSLAPNYYSTAGAAVIYNNTNVLNVTEDNLGQSISLYPNPTNDFSFIKFGKFHEQIKMNIFDSQGKLIKSYVYKNTDLIKIETTKWAAGIYYINLSLLDKMTTVKLVLTN